MGVRERAAELDFSEFLAEEMEAQLKEAGECALAVAAGGWGGLRWARGKTHAHTRTRAPACSRGIHGH